MNSYGSTLFALLGTLRKASNQCEARHEGKHLTSEVIPLEPGAARSSHGTSIIQITSPAMPSGGRLRFKIVLNFWCDETNTIVVTVNQIGKNNPVATLTKEVGPGTTNTLEKEFTILLDDGSPAPMFDIRVGLGRRGSTLLLNRKASDAKVSIGPSYVRVRRGRFKAVFDWMFPPRGSYVACFLTCLAAIFILISGRALFSAVAVAASVHGIIQFSRLKHKHMNMYLHAYDLIFFLRPASLRFALDNVTSVTLRFAWVFSGLAVLLAAVYLLDPTRVPRLYAIALLLIFVALLRMAKRRMRPRELWMQFFDPNYLVNFIDSVPETLRACLRGRILAAKASSMADPLPLCASKKPPPIKTSPPTIIAIMQESLFPPSFYAGIRSDGVFNRFFRSSDGVDRLLRVETFGAGSWMTEFSFMTGIPAHSYGEFRAHVFHWAAGNIRHSLPQSLRELGYYTAVHYPCPLSVMSASRFYRSIGFDEIRDRPEIGFESDNVEDRIRYDYALGWLESHFARTDVPAFLFFESSTNHFPHDVEFRPERRCGHVFNAANGAEVNEYLRRLSFSVDDLATFRTALGKRFPDRQFLIVHFGDHQPPLCWDFLGTQQQSWLNSLQRLPTGKQGFLTYFALEGVNYALQVPADLPRTIEIANLATVLLLAAGLPLDAVHQRRRELMMRHGGMLYFSDGGEVAANLNQQLIDAGLILAH